tara:strand:+ start:21 stop:1286 length:1266 start_codon:yes stop_codon:yes gene_type:complete
MDIITKNFLYRFDLIAKYIYIKYHEININCDFHIKLYKEHINTFNGCWEHPGTKEGIDSFIIAFDKLIQSIKDKGFNDKYSIPLGNNNVIDNGAHRLAISLFYNKDIKYDKINKNGSQLYNYRFFTKRSQDGPRKTPPLNLIYSDHMALEYIKLNKNIRTLILYPIGKDPTGSYRGDKVEKILNEYGKIYYKKKVTLNNTGLDNLIKELYRGEGWIGGLFPNKSNGKTNLCKSNGNDQNIIIYLFYMNDLKKLIEMKEKCRKIYNIGKHSLHVSDYYKDTFRICSSLLNDNSIFYLNYCKHNISNSTKKLLIHYFNKIGEQNEDYCITYSLILEMFGLIQAKDLDYLHKDDNNLNLKQITPHSGKWLSFYHVHKDEIMYNPNNYFYFNGFKFATLHVIKKMKENRKEPKDLNDIKNINNII